MDANTFQKLSARTMNTDTIFDVNHAFCSWSMGLVGEVGELLSALDDDDGDPEKEMGDVLWYAAAFCTQMQRPFCDVVESELIDSNRDRNRALRASRNPLAFAVSMLDHWKKIFCHGHTLDVDAEMVNLQIICRMCVAQCRDGKFFDVAQIMQANVDKLRKRYPDGFTQEASANREA